MARHDGQAMILLYYIIGAATGKVCGKLWTATNGMKIRSSGFPQQREEKGSGFGFRCGEAVGRALLVVGCLWIHDSRFMICDFDGVLCSRLTVPRGKSLLRGLRVLGGGKAVVGC